MSISSVLSTMKLSKIPKQLRQIFVNYLLGGSIDKFHPDCQSYETYIIYLTIKCEKNHFHLRSLTEMHLIYCHHSSMKITYIFLKIQIYSSSTYYQYVTLSKLFNLFEPQSPQLYNDTNVYNSIVIIIN